LSNLAFLEGETVTVANAGLNISFIDGCGIRSCKIVEVNQAELMISVLYYADDW